jgi:hypothetical protein
MFVSRKSVIGLRENDSIIAWPENHFIDFCDHFVSVFDEKAGPSREAREVGDRYLETDPLSLPYWIG